MTRKKKSLKGKAKGLLHRLRGELTTVKRNMKKGQRRSYR